MRTAKAHFTRHTDNAERGRNAILSALFSTTGPEGWAVKVERATDPMFEHLKDRAIALAQERAAEEADNVALTEAEFVILDKTGESPPTTREMMFHAHAGPARRYRRSLAQDISPRELWASITDEHIMRRELARALRDAGNQSYTIDQESVPRTKRKPTFDSDRPAPSIKEPSNSNLATTEVALIFSTRSTINC